MSETTCEKDLGIHIDPLLNFDKHIEIQTKKARALSGMIMRTFINKHNAELQRADPGTKVTG